MTVTWHAAPGSSVAVQAFLAMYFVLVETGVPRLIEAEPPLVNFTTCDWGFEPPKVSEVLPRSGIESFA